MRHVTEVEGRVGSGTYIRETRVALLRSQEKMSRKRCVEETFLAQGLEGKLDDNRYTCMCYVFMVGYGIDGFDYSILRGHYFSCWICEIILDMSIFHFLRLKHITQKIFIWKIVIYFYDPQGICFSLYKNYHFHIEKYMKNKIQSRKSLSLSYKKNSNIIL